MINPTICITCRLVKVGRHVCLSKVVEKLSNISDYDRIFGMNILRIFFAVLVTNVALSEMKAYQKDQVEEFTTALQTFFTNLWHDILDSTTYQVIDTALTNRSIDGCETVFENAYQDFHSCRQSFLTFSALPARSTRFAQQPSWYINLQQSLGTSLPTQETSATQCGNNTTSQDVSLPLPLPQPLPDPTSKAV